GRGYWFVAADCGIFSFGDAAFFGSAGKMKLNRPIVGMAPTPTGRGYWFVAADGGIFSFGDAAFYGSTGAIHLAKPIVGIAATPTGRGYWFVASDGGIFTYGDAQFFGSAANPPLRPPSVSLAAPPGAPGAPGAPGTPGTPGTPGGGPPPAENVNWGPAGATTILARAATGGGNAFRPWMSEDGRYLVFDSDGKQVMGPPADPVAIR